MKIPNLGLALAGSLVSLARIVSEDSQLSFADLVISLKSSKDS